MELGGLHHVTAVTGRASENVDFYTGVLGMRLVKKTVNQDDVSAYHLFYGDEVGNPGTEMTFFDWSWAGQDPEGSGKISATAFRVPGRAALDWWAGRFDDLGVRHGGIEDRNGRAFLPFTDPEGQSLELADGGEAGTKPGTPYPESPVPQDKGILGLHASTITVRNVGTTSRVLTQALGFRAAGEYEKNGARVVVFEVGPGGPGAEVHLEERPDLRPHRQVGTGGVHHVAFRTPNDKEHAEWRENLKRLGIGVTPVIDRFYFRSVYFREPGGVLFELATDGPGFATDEDPAHLGERLSLPPFLEQHREMIEGGLQPISPAGEGALR
ncbi:MAG: ring-cleaving dioxygenase [Rubrobacteraceae bacterium]